MSSNAPFKNFVAENEVTDWIPPQDQVYRFDSEAYTQSLKAKPWKDDPKYFTQVRISAVALIKMVTHARSGGDIEIMGLMQGKIVDRTMVVMDAFALPVEGTETRVNAQDQAYEYMVQYLTKSKEVGRLENAIGWYHSHPGYGCWLSGIDVNTQTLNQQFQDPWLAVVVDPKRTASAGKVDLGAFRTYPKGHRPKQESTRTEFQPIPLEKIEDFGVHCNEYYPLEVSYFKSSLDTAMLQSLWTKYWAYTLSQSSLIANRDFLTARITDVAHKFAKNKGGMVSITHTDACRPKKKSSEDSQALKLAQESTQMCCDTIHSAMSQVMKAILFQRQSGSKPNSVAE
ncbi:hypothetical protein BJ085DRAFT_24401 [Dimargaris cristalligena]|uniref:COP9 signalosome complex subunit 5 n=1 Tax=Dimargaris cristalligena TaxID=215637 RepID=A0A4P9ZS65_9FUNG|nr:hypothetical protein BJ085DRAFT_24401 [Dimargaris cristalligena]|eukprot:RKP36396.1 hypothetical protein BJ085DRAFT_24401 [Dimargaris cristalligena]